MISFVSSKKNDLMNLINGKDIAIRIKAEIKSQVAEIVSQGKRAPHLVTVLVGNDGGSRTYVGHKAKACGEVGFTSTNMEYPSSLSEPELLEIVKKLNEDEKVDGFIVQLPLPSHIDERKVIESIDPAKDVDGFHPINLGKMMIGVDSFLPATPSGIIDLLAAYKIETQGKNCVVLGRSNIVGTPMSLLLSRKAEIGNATVTVVHSRTKNIEEICSKADIIIAAIGQPGFVKENMVKEGAVVIDVGTTRVDAPNTKRGWRLVGDVDFENVAEKCSFISPVPGGVGPMTIVSLMKNTLKAYNNRL